MTEQWQELKETITEMRDSNGTLTQQEVCKFLANYMEVLEKQMQQPCEDCIRRQAVIEHICESKECYKEECKGRTLKRCPDLQWVFDLPPVTPQRPEGRWIATENEEMNIDGYFCSCCDLPMETEERTKFCPNCGAEMSGGEEDEDSN